METTYRILRVDGTEQSVTVSLPESPCYETLSAIVKPVIGLKTNFERVAVLFDGRACDMFVDENGHLKGLARNEAATAIYRANWLSRHPGTDPESLDFIAGPAVLFTRRVWF